MCLVRNLKSQKEEFFLVVVMRHAAADDNDCKWTCNCDLSQKILATPPFTITNDTPICSSNGRPSISFTDRLAKIEEKQIMFLKNKISSKG